jgi:hypothetical protein
MSHLPEQQMMVVKKLNRLSAFLIAIGILFLLAAIIFPVFALSNPVSSMYQGLELVDRKIAATKSFVDAQPISTDIEQQLKIISLRSLEALSHSTIALSAFILKAFALMAIVCGCLVLGIGFTLRRFVRALAK